MDIETIQAEIQRLAPWYFDLDIGGVRTTIAAASDSVGHRPLWFPAVLDGFWRDKTVLDVGCNEGPWSMGAIRHGAAHVDAFDCRASNIEKARLCATVAGLEPIDFHVETCESWIERFPDRRYDIVLLCGILYHFMDPEPIIRRYTALARDWIVVTCKLFGDQDGYTRFDDEPDHIACNWKTPWSVGPNTANTLLNVFAQCGFRPIHLRETGSGGPVGGFDTVLASRCRQADCTERVTSGAGDELEIYLTPVPITEPGARRVPFDLQVVLFNRRLVEREVVATLRMRDAAGRCLHQIGPRQVQLPAHVAQGDTAYCESIDYLATLDLADCRDKAVIEVVLDDPASGTVTGANELVVTLRDGMLADH